MLLQYLNKDVATVANDAAAWLLIMMLLLGYNEKVAVIVQYCQHRCMHRKAITVYKLNELGPCKKYRDVQCSK